VNFLSRRIKILKFEYNIVIILNFEYL